MSINNWLVGFNTVMVLSLSDLTLNSPFELIKSVAFAVFTYSKATAIGLLLVIGLSKLILYSIEFPIPTGTSLTKSPLFFSSKGIATVVPFNDVGVIVFVNVLE